MAESGLFTIADSINFRALGAFDTALIVGMNKVELFWIRYSGKTVYLNVGFGSGKIVPDVVCLV